MPTRRQILSTLGLAGLTLAIPFTFKTPTVYRLRSKNAPELDPLEQHIVYHTLKDLWAFWAPVRKEWKLPYPYQIDQFRVTGPVVRRISYDDPTPAGMRFRVKEGDGPEEVMFQSLGPNSIFPRWTGHTLSVVEGRHLQRC